MPAMTAIGTRVPCARSNNLYTLQSRNSTVLFTIHQHEIDIICKLKGRQRFLAVGNDNTSKPNRSHNKENDFLLSAVIFNSHY